MNLNIRPLKQTRSMNCAQTAVAMVAGVSIDRAEQVFGHGHKSLPQETIDALRKLGVSCKNEFTVVGRTRDTSVLPPVAMVRLVFLKRSGGHLSVSGKVRKTGHLVVWANGQFYDPGHGLTFQPSQMNPEIVIERFLEVS